VRRQGLAGLLALGIAASLAAAALAQTSLPRGRKTDLRISFIDVGQGDAIWIRTPDTGQGSKNILIDGGPDRGRQNRLTTYLQTYGVLPGAVIDYVIVTHPHDDHYPALIDVLAQYQVATVIDSGYPKAGEYAGFLALARAETVNGRPAQVVDLRHATDVPLDWGRGVTARIVYTDSADARDMGSHNTRENNASAVIRLELGAFSFLFMGDAEGKTRKGPPETARFVERVLLGRFSPAELRATVLKAGHHGSETGSTLPFLRAVQPKVVVVMTGRRSFNGRFLPDEDVIERYEELDPDVLILRTDDKDEDEGHTTKDDQDGDDIYMRTDGRTLRVYQALGPDRRRRWVKVAELTGE
jgi:beta-lactamase superfamily II metal-dependent hydrolase